MSDEQFGLFVDGGVLPVGANGIFALSFGIALLVGSLVRFFHMFNIGMNRHGIPRQL